MDGRSRPAGRHPDYAALSLSTMSNIDQRIAASFGAQRLMETLGARLALVADGEVQIALAFSKRLSQQHGVFSGDTLYAESEVLDKRESHSRPQQGIVTVKTSGRNQSGRLVCDCLRSVLVWKRGLGPDGY